MSTDELTGVRPWSANILGCPWRRGRWNGGSLSRTRSFTSRDVVTQIVEPWGAQTYRSGLSAACGGSDR